MPNISSGRQFVTVSSRVVSYMRRAGWSVVDRRRETALKSAKCSPVVLGIVWSCIIKASRYVPRVAYACSVVLTPVVGNALST